MANITLKFGNMRKAQDFTIYPFDKNSVSIIIQSDKTIASIDHVTGEMKYNSRPGGAYFIHLVMPDAKKDVMKPEVLQQIKDLIIGGGDTLTLGGGAMVVTADNSGRERLV